MRVLRHPLITRFAARGRAWKPLILAPTLLCSVTDGVKHRFQMTHPPSPATPAAQVDAQMNTPPPQYGLQKRSIAIAGHKTSMALEPEFWAALEAIAAARGVTLAALVAAIDSARAAAASARPLASAVRVFALLQGRQGEADTGEGR
jgi:predicted DNA-binding ribbon-helix-helix protein